jgi:hypothetical protein
MRQGCRTESDPRGIINGGRDRAIRAFRLFDDFSYALSINPPASDPIALMAAKPVVAMPGE